MKVDEYLSKVCLLYCENTGKVSKPEMKDLIVSSIGDDTNTDILLVKSKEIVSFSIDEIHRAQSESLPWESTVKPIIKRSYPVLSDEAIAKVFDYANFCVAKGC